MIELKYKELLKRREEKRKKLAEKKNPFMLCKKCSFELNEAINFLH